MCTNPNKKYILYISKGSHHNEICILKFQVAVTTTPWITTLHHVERMSGHTDKPMHNPE